MSKTINEKENSKISVVEAAKEPFLATVTELSQTFQAYSQYSDRKVRKMGLTPCQFDVIAALGNTPNINMRQLAEKTLVTKGTLTGIVDRLEKKHLVRREVPENNRRSFIIALTNEGQSIFESVFPDHVIYLKQKLGKLSEEELIEINQALRKLKSVF